MWTGRPVRVDVVRRCVNARWPVKRTNSGCEFDMVRWLCEGW